MRTLLPLILSLLFSISAIAKITGWDSSLKHRQRLNVPLWLWCFTGWAQLVGVVGLLLGLIEPRFGRWAGGWLALVMISALVAHLRVRDHWQHYVTGITLLGLSLLCIAGLYIAG